MFDLYTPLIILCKNIIENKELIKLNPVFGGKLKPQSLVLVTVF